MRYRNRSTPYRAAPLRKPGRRRKQYCVPLNMLYRRVCLKE